ncbi:heparinase II/III family protein [Mucilaginibacter terrae]|uniref:heparinase II/III domain-containing protein n=1 Tax=Mucilaginibacter terrae TaxID=1955052 RepID=UPI0036326CC5
MFKIFNIVYNAIIIVIICCCYVSVKAQVIPIPQHVTAVHPRIYTSNSEKQQLTDKVNQFAWAKAVIDRTEKKLKPYLAYFQKDSTWLVSRLQMYWKSHHTDIYTRVNDFVKAEGYAPVPTVRYTGSRDWSTPYSSPAIKDLVPYADPDDGSVYMMSEGKGVWVQPSKSGLNIERINESIISLAQDAAFLYWYTGDKKYADFALPVLTTYIKGLYYLKLPLDADEHKPNKISGLTSFEVIHESVIIPTVISYDFLYTYLEQKHPGFGKQFAAPVFQKWADNITLKGVTNNNWNIFEARFLSYLSMALDDDDNYENAKGVQYYLDIIFNRTMPAQVPLTESLKYFDTNTGIWYEAPGYSLSVSEDFLKTLLLTDRVMKGNAKPIVPTLKKAVIATAQYLMPNKHTVSFGDAHYDKLSNKSIEYMIAWCNKYREKTNLDTFTSLLKYSQGDDYDRGITSLFELFFYVPELERTIPKGLESFATSTFYAPNVSWFVQRNGFDINTGMMASVNASMGNHAHANGINVELYGKGYPLAPDFAAGDSYWQQNHHEFYSQFAAHNTVVVDGKSTYGSMRSNYPFVLEDYYPQVLQKNSLFKNVTYTRVSFIEPATKAVQSRLVSIIRTGNSTAYYVDIFRSAKTDRSDVKNEYLYHNLGQHTWLYNAGGKPLMLQPTDELSSAKGDIVGYNYFTDKIAINYNGDFKAQFELQGVSKKAIWMNMWMQGQQGRKIFSVNSPKARSLRNNLVASDIAEAKVPTLVVRQNGEAWTKPFVAVLEPSYAHEQSVTGISSFAAANTNPVFTGLKVASINRTTQYIFADADGKKTNNYQDYSFTGTYAVAGLKSGKLEYLFLGNGQSLFKGNYGIKALHTSVTAALSYENKVWKLYADKAIELSLPYTLKGRQALLTAVDENGKQNTYIGKIITANDARQAVFTLPAMQGKVSTIYLK